MGKSYTMAGEETQRKVKAEMAAHHRELAKAKFRVGVRMVSVEEGPALMVHGNAAAACISKVAPKDRLLHGYDAVMDIDRAVWERLNAPKQRALIDHGLTHIELEPDGKNPLIIDGEIRPKWHVRLHDFELVGFTEVIERHGKDAMEIHNVAALAGMCGAQLVFQFKAAMDDGLRTAKPAEDTPPAATLSEAGERKKARKVG